MKKNEYRLNLRNDYVFKVLHYFDEEKGKEFFASLVEAITDERVLHVEFEPTDLYSINPEGKDVRLDLCARVNTETAVDLEMQVYRMHGMPERIAYYNALQYVTQNNKGEAYDVFTRSRSIFLCQHDVFPKLNYYVHHFLWRDDKGMPLTFAMQSHIIEMSKGLKSFNDKKELSEFSMLEKWILFIMFYEEKSENPMLNQLIESEEIFKKAVEVLQMISEDERIRQQAFARHKFEKDMAQLRRDAERIKTEGLAEALEEGKKQGIQQGIQEGIQQGIQQGIQRGIEQGLEKGIKQGIERGIEKGLAKEKITTISAMLADNVNDDLIMKYTRCTKEQIEEIRKSLG